ncbi:MAG: hypothetical protein HY202_03525 [Nitrospirae bacterium]|nr:hypothetical protein [Nitrospirota bacterium]
MRAWEYRVEELSAVQITNQLNFIGNDGWELIHIRFQEGEAPSYLCFFKRQKDQGLF